ncbi:MAG: hypothetical protein SNJ71_03715, partial [Bacteroidales bacterium]
VVFFLIQMYVFLKYYNINKRLFDMVRCYKAAFFYVNLTKIGGIKHNVINKICNSRRFVKYNSLDI